MADTPAPRDYCLGFVLDPTATRVLLMEKRRPTWQMGLLNGIGGKVEAGETPAQAMARECREETGLEIDAWQGFGAIDFDGGQVHVFHATANLRQARSMTDETVLDVEIARALEGQYALVDSVQDVLAALHARLGPGPRKPGP